MSSKYVGAIADDRNVDVDVLVDRRSIDIDMYLLRARRERVEPSGDPVVEARADADHQIAIVHRPVGFPRAVHTEHAKPLRIGGRVGTKPHQRRRDRIAGKLDEFAQELARLRAGIDDAAAGVEHRTLRALHQLDGRLDLVDVALQPRLVALVRKFVRLEVHPLGELNVLRDVDHDRTRPSAAGDVERFVQNARQVRNVLHQVVVLGAGPRDADGVAFLERVVADEMCRHLSGQADDRDRVHQRVGKSGHGVRRARAGGHQQAADLAGRAGIAFRRMRRALFMADEDVLDLLLLEERVIDRQHGAAGIAEHMFDPLIGQSLDHHFRAGHFPCHRSLLRFPTHQPPESKRGQ